MIIWRIQKKIAVITLILVFINTVCPGYSIAVEPRPPGETTTSLDYVLPTNVTEISSPKTSSQSDTVAGSLSPLTITTADENTDTIDIDKTYKLFHSTNKASHARNTGDVAYIRHISHMPASDQEIKPPIPSNDITVISKAPEAEIESEFDEIDSVFEEEETLTDTPSTEEAADEQYHSNELIADNATYNKNIQENASENDFPIKNKAGHYDVGFKAESGLDLLSFSSGNSKLVMSPAGAEKVAGKINLNTITYEDIYPDTDIKYTAEDYSLKEEITIHKFNSKNEFTFQLDLTNVEYEIMPEGQIQFTDLDTENPVFYMAKSYAIDNEGNLCDSINTSLSEDGELVLTVDSEWLARAVYPVIIDPTIYLITSAEFKRSSNAYKSDYTAVGGNKPRYENGKYGQGIMIEEGTAQYFPYKRSLRFTSSWTSGTLNGTYTVSIRGGTGKLTLSGGASGVVTVGNNLTFTISNATVKFTPSDGTPEKCQLEKKRYATQWHPGDTDGKGIRGNESLSLPSVGVFNKGNWTVELVFIPQDEKGAGTQGGILWKAGSYCLGTNANGYLYGSVISGGNTYSITSDVIPVIGATYNIMFAGDGNNIRLCINGEQIGSDIPYIETTNTFSKIYIGTASDGTLECNQCNGIIDDLRISKRARTLEEHQAAYSSNQPLPVDGVTSCKMDFDGNLLTKAYSVTSGGGVNTKLLSTTFARSGDANKQDGTLVEEDQPRFEPGKFRHGIMIEEGTRNYLSGWGRDFESTSEFSLNQYNSGTVTVDTSEQREGLQCLKWVGSDANSLRGIKTIDPIELTSSQTITYSVYLKGSGTCRLGVSFDSGAWKTQSNTITLTEEWTRYSLTYSGAGETCLEVAQYGVSSPATIYMDCFQAEKKPFMTSWEKIVRDEETLTLPASCITEGSWTAEMVYIPQYAPATGPRGKVLWYAHAYSDYDYMLLGTNSSGYLYGTVCRSGTTPPYPPDPPFVAYSIVSNLVPTVGSSYSIMFAGDGSKIRLCVNGTQIGSDTIYVEPRYGYNGDIYLGSSNEGTNQCNGIIDDLRISNRARTLAEHQAAYSSNQPLPVDDSTIVKFNFDGSLDNSNSYTTDIYGTGILPYWNYASASLGGGWTSLVNTYNLNLLLDKCLFNIPGRGIPIQESITYNSFDGRSGPLGNGWHLNSDVSLLETIDGSIIYNGGDGAAFTFIRNSDGSYTAPPGIYLTLVKESSYIFTLTDKNQTVYTFENNKLTEIVDRNENTTSFTYTDKGNPATVTDASGRNLTYIYDNSGRVIEISNPDQQSYQFAYENNYLATVTDPDNKIFTLTYDTEGHLSTFTDPLSRMTTYNVGADGQLVYINDARTEGEDIYQTAFAQTDENTQLVTTVTDPLEHVYTYYHDPRAGNLIEFRDPVDDAWEYGWSNNNLVSVTDAKGTTSYTYDSRGNILTKTTDSSSGKITETMTYDDLNQVLTYEDGGERKSYYHYDVKGNLLSTSNPDIKESNGRKYDQYGNVIEYCPRVSGRANLVSNGSFERPGTDGNLLADWTQEQTGNASLEGFNSHGNSALKISASEPTEVLFYQRVPGVNQDRLTLRADIKLDNVQYQDSLGGVMIKIGYRDGMYDTWYVWGNGTFPLVVTSLGHEDATVYVGLSNATGTVWFDGIQLEGADTDFQYSLSDFNAVENSSFENGLTNWSLNGGYTTIDDLNVWDENRSLRIYRNEDSSGEESTVYQDIATYGGEPLTLSGMVYARVGTSESDKGAFLRLEYYDSSNQIIGGTTVETGYVKDTDGFTRLSCLATAPLDAHHARVSAVLNGRGRARFDSIKLIPRNTETYTYNSAGNYIINSEDPMGYSSQYSYNNTGTLSSFTDPIGNTTGYYYDNLNRLQQVQDPLSNHAYYGYDEASNLINSRDPRSTSSNDNTYLTAFDPNEINQLSTLTDPINKATAHTYDRAGNLISLMQPNGREITYGYNDANYLEQKNLDNGRYFAYAYDGAKNLIEVTDQDSNSYVWDYDGAGRVKYSIDSLGKRCDYSWDGSHNLTAITEGEDSKITYKYGKTNRRLLSLTAPIGTMNYSYDENGRVFQVKYSSSSYKKITYHPNGWCHNIQDDGYPGIYPFNYQYYNNGNIASILSWAGEENYTYDADGRLTSWTYTPFSGNSVQESYQYDAAGNLTVKGTDYYTYDQANRITNIGYEYDDNGNLTSDGTYEYAYNEENQLIEVRRSSDNGLIATYTYYFNGLRKSKTVGEVTTYYHWDAFGNVVQENDTQNNSIAYYYDPSGNPIGFMKNGDVNQKYIYHTNMRGDVVSITDSTDTIQAQYTYDPWGTQTSYTGTITQSLRYAGYYFDEETGLYYLKSRYYSPETGRFLTKDAYSYVKYEVPQTLNLYVYCGNNPVNLTDPTGTDFCETLADWGSHIGGVFNKLADSIFSDSQSDDSWKDVAWEWFNTQDPGVQLVVAVPIAFVVAGGEVLLVVIIEGTPVAMIMATSEIDMRVIYASEKYSPYVGQTIANTLPTAWESVKLWANKPNSPIPISQAIKKIYNESK